MGFRGRQKLKFPHSSLLDFYSPEYTQHRYRWLNRGIWVKHKQYSMDIGWG